MAGSSLLTGIAAHVEIMTAAARAALETPAIPRGKNGARMANGKMAPTQIIAPGAGMLMQAARHARVEHAICLIKSGARKKNGQLQITARIAANSIHYAN